MASSVVPGSAPSSAAGHASLVATALGEGRGIDPVWLYFDPRGRIGRATFWRHGMLALLLLDIVAIALLQIAGFEAELAEKYATWGLMWPLIALSAKRWHDINRSGWFVLVNLVPAIGQLVALVCNGFLPGTRGPNRFGPDPLARLRTD